MNQVNIGTTDISIAPLVLGGNVFGWTVDEKHSFELLDAFVDRGFNCIDTADFYMKIAPGCVGGDSETVIGRWLAQGGGRRERIVLCTKVGLEMAPGDRGLSAAYIPRAVEASLRRLQTDVIDLYISHRDDPATPVEETLGAYQKLIDQGKVRVIGASGFSADRLAEALDASRDHGLPKYASLQLLYNLYDRSDYEGALEALCQERRLSVFPYFVLASGFLTGKYRNKADTEGRLRASLAAGYVNDRGLRILAAMDEVAAESELTLAQVAVAWVISRSGITAPVVSATSMAQLEGLIGAVEAQLTADQRSRLDAASAFDTAGEHAAG